MATTDIVLEVGKVGEKHADGFKLLGGSAASVVTAFSDMKPKWLRLKLDGPEKIIPQSVMTVTEVEAWLDRLRSDGYTVTLTDSNDTPATLHNVQFTADGERIK